MASDQDGSGVGVADEDYGRQIARLDQRDEDILRRLTSIESKQDAMMHALGRQESKVAKVSVSTAFVTTLIIGGLLALIPLALG